MKAKTLTAHQSRVHSIAFWTITVALALILISMIGCQPAKNGCKSTHGMSGYSSINIDLPEEIKAITCDRNNPEPLYGWQDAEGNIYIEFKHY